MENIMKRSEINKIILDALDFADEMGFKLPPFARVDAWRMG